MTVSPIKLLVFRSSTKIGLHSFVAEDGEERLPQKFAPWTKIGVVRANQQPPYGLKRDAIEQGIAAEGFQLWRKTKTG